MTSSRKISKKDLGKLLSRWGQEFTVFVPSRETGQVAWAKWDGTDTSFIDWYRNTVVSAKANFLLPVEEMFSFQKDAEGYHIDLPALNGHKQLLFGIRPCDAKALSIIAPIFEELYEDPYYLSKRRNAVLVGLGCTNPCDSCFCTSLDISPGESGDVDLMVTDIGDYLFIETVSEAGKELIATASELEAATEADEARAKEAKEASYRKVTRKVDAENVQEKLLACFEDEDHGRCGRVREIPV